VSRDKEMPSDHSNLEVTLMREILAVLLEQKQWKKSRVIADWLVLRGDVAASIVKVEVMLRMHDNLAALESLVILPISVRKVVRVRQLEARIIHEFGYQELAKQVYLSSLNPHYFNGL